MPELNKDQFHQPELPGMPLPQHGPAEHPQPSPPSYPVGQGVLPLDESRISTFNPNLHDMHSVGRGGVVPVSERSPKFNRALWGIGGAHRAIGEGGGVPRDWEQALTQHWESMPVETFGASTTLHSNQLSNERIPSGTKDEWGDEQEATAHTLNVGDSRVEELKKASRFTDQGVDYEGYAEKLPWVLEASDHSGGTSRFILEGHHRTVAQRERGDGSVRAHVYRTPPGAYSMDSIRKFAADATARMAPPSKEA